MKRLAVAAITLLTVAPALLASVTGVALAGNTRQPTSRTAVEAVTVGAKQIAAGSFSSYAIKRNGSLWAWGANALGELGLGNTKNHLLPQRVGRATTWTTLAAGEMFCLALRSDGSLWAWGANADGQLGLGGGSNAPRLSPKRVGISLWRAIGAGMNFSVAIKRDGSLWAWGNNDAGQLGVGDTEPRSRPTRVGRGNDWKAIAVGFGNVLALKRNGSLWAWGDNTLGQLGIGTADELAHPRPIRIGAGRTWMAISTDIFSFALRRDGSLWAWGANADGQLGLGDRVDHLAPTRVGSANNWRAIAAGNVFTLALKRNGSLWAWGDNETGDLGLGDKVTRYRPTRVGKGTTWTRIAASCEFGLALKVDGSLWAWGRGYNGQLGLGDRRDRLSPTRVTRLR
jgi:alpha-tubulin suppressor-like RCC1 family protein